MKKLLSFLISLSLLLMAFSSAGAEKTATYPDASAYADSIVTSTIDASICLDYSAGIEAGVYKWVASQDGSYYTLAAVDENGEPKTMQEAAINVGANNEERGPMGGFGGNGQGGMPQGDGQNRPGGGMGGFGGGRGQGGQGGMRGGFGGFGGGGSVYQGVYMNANITNVNYQTSLMICQGRLYSGWQKGFQIPLISHLGSVWVFRMKHPFLSMPVICQRT